MDARPSEIEQQTTRLGGSLGVFVFAATIKKPLEEQASTLFSAVSGEIERAGGWLLEPSTGSSPKGFSLIMGERERGELAWDRVCGLCDEGHHKVLMKKPNTMLAMAGYPCWALDRHLYSVDLFNPQNELLLTCDQSETRLWSLWFWPPKFVLPDATFSRLLGATANALDADYGFAGNWLSQAIFAYRFAEFSDDKYLKTLEPGVRLTDMAYPYMVLRRRDLIEGVLERIQDTRLQVCRPGHEPMNVYEFLGPNSDYIFLRLGWLYPQGDDSLVTQVAELIGKPYVKTMVLRDTTSRWL